MKNGITVTLILLLFIITVNIFSMDNLLNLDDELYKYQTRLIIYFFPYGITTGKPIFSLSELKNIPDTSKIDISNYFLRQYKDSLKMLNRPKVEVSKKAGYVDLGCEFIRKNGEVILSIAFPGNDVMIINDKYYKLDNDLENFIYNFISNPLRI